MTKKHFKILAAAIYEITSPLEGWAMAEAVIQVGRELNPRFDKTRFLEACDLKEEPCS